MAHTTGFSHHAAGAVYGDAPVDLPIEPLVRETPDEFRARMDAKRETAAAARLTVAAPAPRTPAPLPVGPVPTPRPRPARSGNSAKGLRDEIAAAGLTSETLRAWATEHHFRVARKGVPSRTVLAEYLNWQHAVAHSRYATPKTDELTWVEEPERKPHANAADLIAANPSIGHIVDPAMVAAAIVAESIPISRPAATPDDPEPATAAKVAEKLTAAGVHIDPWQRRLLDAFYPEPNDTPPIVIALAAVSRMAVELADLRPRLSPRERRTVDATLVALGAPDPSLLQSLFGAK